VQEEQAGRFPVHFILRDPAIDAEKFEEKDEPTGVKRLMWGRKVMWKAGQGGRGRDGMGTYDSRCKLLWLAMKKIEKSWVEALGGR
jgi:hypothetical protein